MENNLDILIVLLQLFILLVWIVCPRLSKNWYKFGVSYTALANIKIPMKSADTSKPEFMYSSKLSASIRRYNADEQNRKQRAKRNIELVTLSGDFLLGW